MGHQALDCQYNTSPLARSRGAARTAIGAGMSTGTDACDASVLEFILDSGATDHMVDSTVHLVNYQTLLKPFRIMLANGDVMYAEGKGDLYLEGNRRMCLSAVLFVPQLSVNLLSVTALTKKGCHMSVAADAIDVYGQDDRLLFSARTLGASYVVRMSSFRLAMVGQGASSSADLWHRRLGHIGKDALSRMVRDDLADGLPCTAQDVAKATGFCDVCVQSKQHGSRMVSQDVERVLFWTWCTVTCVVRSQLCLWEEDGITCRCRMNSQAMLSSSFSMTSELNQLWLHCRQSQVGG
jgi:hypothetical protein